MPLRVDLSILNQKGTPAFFSDTFANRPAFGFAGRVFIATDTAAIYEDTGTSWTLISNVSSGAGTLEQVTTNGNTTTKGIVVTSGNVAIGTATAGAPLDIHTTGTAAQFNGTGTNNAYIVFQNAGASKWRIGNTYAVGSNYLDFYNNSLATNALRLNFETNEADFTGSVGIKSTVYSPNTFSLDVNGGLIVKNTGTTAQFVLINADPSGGGNNGFIQMTAGGTSGTSYAQLQTYYGASVIGGALRLQPNGQNVLIGTTTDNGNKLQVTGTGYFSSNVGIGTSSPNNITGYGGLTINGTNGAFTYWNINGTDTGRIITDSASMYFDNLSTGALVFRTTIGSTERMRITNGGNVLVGTATDGGQKLQVAGAINMYNYTSLTTSTKTGASASTINFVMGVDYGNNVGGDNIGGLVVININQTNTNASASNSAYVGIIINPRGTGGTITQISKVLGPGMTSLIVTTNFPGNTIQVTAVVTDGSNFRASLSFIGGGGTS
jgi:hypothetical protein